jgi:hypothetical protein
MAATTRYVLDTFALIAFFNRETGHEAVRSALREALLGGEHSVDQTCVVPAAPHDGFDRGKRTQGDDRCVIPLLLE